MTKSKFDFESLKDFSGQIAVVLAFIGLVVFVIGIFFLRRDDLTEPRYWDLYNTLFAVWLIAELAAFGLGSVTIISRIFDEWGTSKTGIVFAWVAVAVAICNAVFLLLVLYSFYFGGGEFTLF